MTTKIYISIVVILIFFLNPLLCSAYYVIHLKNGRMFKTNHYWKEENKTLFYTNQGVFGVENDFIIKIEENNFTDENKENSIIYKEEENELVNNEGELASNIKEEGDVKEKDERVEEKIAERNEEEEDKKEKIDWEYYKKKDAELRDQLDQSLERFRQASGNKDSGAKKNVLKEMTKISKQLYDLADEVKEKNEGMLPDWWRAL